MLPSAGRTSILSPLGQSGPISHLDWPLLLTLGDCFTGILPSILSPAFAQTISGPATIFKYSLGSNSEAFTFALNIPNDYTDLYTFT